MAANTLNLPTTLKLPDGVQWENVEGIEVKVTTKEGDGFSGKSWLTDEIREAKTPLSVELAPKFSLEQSKEIQNNNEGSAYRRVTASSPNKLPIQLSDSNPDAFHFDQPKYPITEVQLAEKMSALTVPKEDTQYHSFPDAKVVQPEPVDMSRPHSDTDITTIPDITTLPFQVQDDDAASNQKTSLHVKGGERLILEEPVYEGLSFNVDSEVDYTEDEHHEEEPCGLLPSLPMGSLRAQSRFSTPDSPTTSIAEASPFLIMDGPTQVKSSGGSSKNVRADLSYCLKHKYYGHTTVFQSEAVFPSQKPYVSTGGDEYPDVFVEYSSRPTVWPFHQYTENPMRYDVGLIPKKSMNSVYYSLDESFAFKEERNKNLLIEKKHVFQKIVQLDPNKFVPIIAYLHDGCSSRSPMVGYQIMEYYKDGSIHDMFEVCVNSAQCNCFLEIYHKKYDDYFKAKKERDMHRSPYMFNLPPEYYLKLEELEIKVSSFSIQLENLVRNFSAVVIQMLEAVMSLHSHNLIHRDIKPHNFLVKRLESCHCPQLIFCSCEQPGFQVLLGDYDFVTFATDMQWDLLTTKYEYSCNTKRGTVGYRPIELNFDNEGVEICDPKSDVYSLGASILEILAGTNWKTCDTEIEDMLSVCLSPLSKKSEDSFNPQQYQEKLTEKFIDLEEKNTQLMRQGIANKELSELNQILASICTIEPSVDIKETINQFKVLAVKRHDGICTVLSTVIKASQVNDKCIMYCWNIHESNWICAIIQQCVKVHPQNRPHIQQLLTKKRS